MSVQMLAKLFEIDARYVAISVRRERLALEAFPTDIDSN